MAALLPKTLIEVLECECNEADLIMLLSTCGVDGVGMPKPQFQQLLAAFRSGYR